MCARQHRQRLLLQQTRGTARRKHPQALDCTQLVFVIAMVVLQHEQRMLNDRFGGQIIVLKPDDAHGGLEHQIPDPLFRAVAL